ncbi:hypothetical protein BX661DRAFT_777 [Kickxella alabastrina]|uniref:uncharacterized protein n=1 Tax=Kickxella alabastrina TaxID=61397 RepID=UPI00222019A2|nr:uncharacterized protein BX661DRAFT_777 [Kickxella alabastrina]KAI7834475.1 hypothetical protein BX661DRAFT_777 [Kickxella alabastrina]
MLAVVPRKRMTVEALQVLQAVCSNIIFVALAAAERAHIGGAHDGQVNTAIKHLLGGWIAAEVRRRK